MIKINDNIWNQLCKCVVNTCTYQRSLSTLHVHMMYLKLVLWSVGIKLKWKNHGFFKKGYTWKHLIDMTKKLNGINHLNPMRSHFWSNIFRYLIKRPPINGIDHFLRSWWYDTFFFFLFSDLERIETKIVLILYISTEDGNKVTTLIVSF